MSTAHFLPSTWDMIAEHLEDHHASVTLTAIDYLKALNRLEHLPCLEALARLRLPTELLLIIGSFFIRPENDSQSQGVAIFPQTCKCDR